MDESTWRNPNWLAGAHAWMAALVERIAARRPGGACRAVNGHVPGDDAQTFTRLRMFLDGRA